MNYLFWYLIGCFILLAFCMGLDNQKYKRLTQVMFIVSAPWWVTLAVLSYGSKIINQVVTSILLYTFDWVRSIQNEKA
jgi:hypothetical protein